MIAFLLSPFGRRISAVLIIVAALFLFVKRIEHTAFERGRAEGQRAAWEQAEKQNTIRWAEIQKQLDSKETKAEEKIVEVEKAHTALKQEKNMRSDLVKQISESFEPAYAMIGPKLAEAIPAAAPEIQELLTLKEMEIEKLKDNVIYYAGLADRYESLFEQAQTAYKEVIASKDAQTSQLTTERDFYKAAFHESPPKKHGGFWHKVKRVVTLGIAN